MVSRPPHTIPFSSGRLMFEEKAKKLAMIQKDIPLTQEVIKYIIGEETYGDLQSDEVSENVIDVPARTEFFEEEADESAKRSFSEKRPTAGRGGKLSQILEMIANKEDLEEIKEDTDKVRTRHLVVLTEESSSEEEEAEVVSEEEKPFYDLDERCRELTEQEEENNKYIQELSNNADIMYSKYKEMRKLTSREIRNLLEGLRIYDDEELEEDLREPIEEILDEEDISPLDSLDDEEE